MGNILQNSLDVTYESETCHHDKRSQSHQTGTAQERFLRGGDDLKSQIMFARRWPLVVLSHVGCAGIIRNSI